MRFKFLEHTADVKFRAFGKTLEETFANSALAMFNSMFNGKIKEKIKERIKVNGKDLESLQYNFLEELLILFDSKEFFLAKVKNIKINQYKNKEYKLEAEVSGDKAENYKLIHDVKAVTYNEMFIKKEKDNYVAQVVVDV